DVDALLLRVIPEQLDLRGNGETFTFLFGRRDAGVQNCGGRGGCQISVGVAGRDGVRVMTTATLHGSSVFESGASPSSGRLFKDHSRRIVKYSASARRA